MAVLKHTSPTASPVAPTPLPWKMVPSASTRRPVAPGMRGSVIGASFSMWTSGRYLGTRTGVVNAAQGLPLARRHALR